jgi:uncharacterized protein YjiS (DUF1127 family)
MLSPLLSLIRRIVQRHQAQQSIGSLLARRDDHLLDDIGLTRDTAAGLIADPPATDPFHGQTRFTPAAATAAISCRSATSEWSRPR